MAPASHLVSGRFAFVVPVALAVSGRHRAFISWSIATTAVAGVALLKEGTHGLEAYVSQLQHPPPGTGAVTLEAAIGDRGPFSIGLRIAIVCPVGLVALVVIVLWPRDVPSRLPANSQVAALKGKFRPDTIQLGQEVITLVAVPEVESHSRPRSSGRSSTPSPL